VPPDEKVEKHRKQRRIRRFNLNHASEKLCHWRRRGTVENEMAQIRWRKFQRGYALEQEMFNRGFAAAWESFKFPSHMELVERGDAIFMFAKGIGIIGIGIAKGGCETLAINNPDRIHNFPNEKKIPEWRVPVHWLEWTDEAGAFRWAEAPNFTFWEVTDESYKNFRENVKAHFLGIA
jgi:hypothetical protein